MEAIVIDKETIKELNEEFKTLTPHERVAKLYEIFPQNEVMLTSSFAATSAMLLKVFSDVNKDQLVYFIDTGYHFKETLIYKEYLTQLYDLNVKSVSAEDWKHKFTTEDETWTKNPDYCCSINKVGFRFDEMAKQSQINSGFFRRKIGGLEILPIVRR